MKNTMTSKTSGRVRSVFLLTDIEGVAGVASHARDSYSDARYYEESRKLLTGEVNAAVEGLLAVGVQEILVVDGHGPGGVLYAAMHEHARLLHGRPITRAQMYGPAWEHDAVVLIGQHARAGVRHGNQNHTYSSKGIDWMRLNGEFVGETLLMALWAGWKNVPTLFLSGDEAACEEAESQVPGIRTAAVKRGISSNVEIALSAPAARELIREQIAQAIEAHHRTPVQPATRPGPYELEVRHFSTQGADLAEDSGGERVDDQTVCYRSPDLTDVICLRHRDS